MIQVFGNLALSPEKAINRHNNFQSFIQGLMLLFRYVNITAILCKYSVIVVTICALCRCATGESWPNIMLGCLKGACDGRAHKEAHESCGSTIAYAYFVSFVFFCSFLVSTKQYFFSRFFKLINRVLVF